MLIIGDLSGIQDYLFDIADQAGGQSRRLRARSFFLQAVTELAALRVLRAAGWADRLDRILLRAAGKFILHGPPLDSAAALRVETEGQAIARWLLQRTGARVRLTLAIEIRDGMPLEQYNRAMRALQAAKLRPLSSLAIDNTEWNTAALVLPPLTPPCGLCKRQPAVQTETDPDGQTLSLCALCAQDLRLGRELPRARWMVAYPEAAGRFDIAGLGVTLHADEPTPPPDALARFQLEDGPVEATGSVPTLTRRLGRHIPLQGHTPLDFDALADAALGAPYLGVLKMDADALGKAIAGLLQKADSLQPLAVFSDELDAFFAQQLDRELAKTEWERIYTVFSGGDDLLLVGPWNVLFDYAYHVRQLFQNAFGSRGLTISGGLAVVSRKTPIHRAAEQAEALLEKAKTEPPGQGRDQFAAFGQVWKWKEHEAVAHCGRCLTHWVSDSVAERGWLQTLLRMTEAQKQEPLTAARLVYHVERNYPKPEAAEPNKRALRNWIDQIAQNFDKVQHTETRYLPAILRYALTATRARTGEDG